MTGDLNTDFGHRHHLYSAALLFFMRRTTPFEPSEPVEPAEPLSHVIKGRAAPRANPEPHRVSYNGKTGGRNDFVSAARLLRGGWREAPHRPRCT